MSFQFEITLGEDTEFGGVWDEQDVLDFLDSEVCFKNRFYKKRKIFSFKIDSILDNLKECKATHYLRYLQEKYFRVIDMQDLIMVYTHYEFDNGFLSISLAQDGDQVILSYRNHRGKYQELKVIQAYFYAGSIDDTRAILCVDLVEYDSTYRYAILDKSTKRAIKYEELCEFLNRHNPRDKTPPKFVEKPKPSPQLSFEFKVIDGIVNLVEKRE
ncbi:hypothetical protein [Helicobacter pametensis]|uniref:hypothetical protein n=1 Tax=Helicobacter pametensis TaxID=95149 RepID=UPI0004816F65|nr:hypothetical protein [Helicobacter pametensis]